MGLAPSAIQETIAELRSETSKPFAVNLWVSTEDPGARGSDEAAFHQSLATIAPLIRSLGGTLPTYKPPSTIQFEDQVRVLIDAKVPVFSFIVGIPPKEILDECRTRGIVTIGAATTPDEAVELEKANVDMIVASGFEAGGHRGSFLRPPEESLFGTFSLVPHVVDRVKVPVIAAGGIADGRGIAAAFALGAQAVQIGTAFLACEESGASEAHRKALLSGKAGQTALTRGFTGRLARGIKNQLMDTMNASGVEILPYPLHALSHAQRFRSGREIRAAGTHSHVVRAIGQSDSTHEGERIAGCAGVGSYSADGRHLISRTLAPRKRRPHIEENRGGQENAPGDVGMRIYNDLIDAIHRGIRKKTRISRRQ